MLMQSGTRVFVVDDEIIIARTLTTILCKSGFLAESFTNPVDALRTTTEDVPDLLISDVIMPQMSGVELAIRIKALCPTCKVLLFSGQAATVDFLEQARKEGHDFQLLSKPIHPNDLLRDSPATVNFTNIQKGVPMLAYSRQAVCAVSNCS
jgi:DNA-binding NtrC family response regulator